MPRTTVEEELEESKEWRWEMRNNDRQLCGHKRLSRKISFATFSIKWFQTWWHIHITMYMPLCEGQFLTLYIVFVGSLGWERIYWRRSKVRESQKCQSEDAWARVCAHAHKGSKQWHAPTLRTPQVVFTHQGTGSVGMCLLCTFAKKSPYAFFFQTYRYRGILEKCNLIFYFFIFRFYTLPLGRCGVTISVHFR